MVLSRLKFMIKEIILILILGFFPFLDGDVFVRHPMVFIFLNLFDLLEFPVMLMTLILVIKF